MRQTLLASKIYQGALEDNERYLAERGTNWRKGANWDSIYPELGYSRVGGGGIPLDVAFQQFGDGFYQVDEHVFAIVNGVLNDTWDSRLGLNGRPVIVKGGLQNTMG